MAIEMHTQNVHKCILKVTLSLHMCMHRFFFQVNIGFRGSSRHTTLKGHSKLACRALVLNQYKTALNHLLQIEDLEKDPKQVIKKKIFQSRNSASM